jgi:hypothetical protein
MLNMRSSWLLRQTRCEQNAVQRDHLRTKAHFPYSQAALRARFCLFREPLLLDSSFPLHRIKSQHVAKSYASYHHNHHNCAMHPTYWISTCLTVFLSMDVFLSCNVKVRPTLCGPVIDPLVT